MMRGKTEKQRERERERESGKERGRDGWMGYKTHPSKEHLQ
jgi:hypothetical protein